MAVVRQAALALALVLALTLLGGCTYTRSRGADFLDFVPISVAHGWGLNASIRATPLLHLGLGASPTVSSRYGYDDRLFHGRWYEYQATFPWSIWDTSLQDLPPDPPDLSWIQSGGLSTVYRWQAMRRAPSGEGERGNLNEPNARSWGRHPPIVREIRGAFLFPERRVLLEFDDLRLQGRDEDALLTMGAPDRATLWITERESRSTPRSWDLFEADVMVVFLGLRVGVRPLEFIDFVLGFTTLDIMGDDLPEPLVWEPVLQESTTSQAAQPAPACS